MTTHMTDAKAIELVRRRLPTTLEELTAIKAFDLTYAPKAVRTYVRAEARKRATAMNGRVDWLMYDSSRRSELQRLIQYAIDENLTPLLNCDF